MKDKIQEEEYVIRVENLIRNYSKSGNGDNKKESNDIRVLKGIDFAVEKKEFVGIIGRSGCGKTTLLKILGLIDKPTTGNVSFYGQNTAELWRDELADIRRRKIGFIFQDFYLMESLSVRENIMLPMILDKGGADDCMESSEGYAKQFGIEELLEKYPYELSGGEKQRVAICRALINNPELILADEPTGNLDSKSGDVVSNTLKKVNKEMGKTVIMVTHDPKMASYCSRIIFLKDGNIQNDICSMGDREEFYQEILDMMKLL